MVGWSRRGFIAGAVGASGLSGGCRSVFLSDSSRAGTPRKTETPVERTLADLHDDDSWRGWDQWGGNISVDDGTAMAGDRSLRVAADRTADRAAAQYRFTSPVDLSGRFPVLGFRWKPAPPYDKGMCGLRLTDRADRTAMFGQYSFAEFVREGAWHRFAPTFRPSRSDADFDFSNVVRLDVYHYTGGEYPAAYWIDGVRFVRSRLDGGGVMIHFDDANPSVYGTAYPIMDRHGVSATFNVISDGIGPEKDLSVRDLEGLAADGWTIAAHPQFDRPLTEMAEAELRTAMERAETFLSAHGFTPSALAWPYNAWDVKSVAVAGDYFELGFAGGAGPHTYPPAPGTELTYPRVSGGVDHWRALVDHANARDGLLCLTYHGVGGEFVPERTFADVIEYIVSKDMEILTASDLLEASAEVSQ